MNNAHYQIYQHDAAHNVCSTPDHVGRLQMRWSHLYRTGDTTTFVWEVTKGGALSMGGG